MSLSGSDARLLKRSVQLILYHFHNCSWYGTLASIRDSEPCKLASRNTAASASGWGQMSSHGLHTIGYQGCSRTGIRRASNISHSTLYADFGTKRTREAQFGRWRHRCLDHLANWRDPPPSTTIPQSHKHQHRPHPAGGMVAELSFPPHDNLLVIGGLVVIRCKARYGCSSPIFSFRARTHHWFALAKPSPLWKWCVEHGAIQCESSLSHAQFSVPDECSSGMIVAGEGLGAGSPGCQRGT